jgi:hypothetical protein
MIVFSRNGMFGQDLPGLCARWQRRVRYDCAYLSGLAIDAAKQISQLLEAASA